MSWKFSYNPLHLNPQLRQLDDECRNQNNMRSCAKLATAFANGDQIEKDNSISSSLYMHCCKGGIGMCCAAAADHKISRHHRGEYSPPLIGKFVREWDVKKAKKLYERSCQELQYAQGCLTFGNFLLDEAIRTRFQDETINEAASKAFKTGTSIFAQNLESETGSSTLDKAMEYWGMGECIEGIEALHSNTPHNNTSENLQLEEQKKKAYSKAYTLLELECHRSHNLDKIVEHMRQNMAKHNTDARDAVSKGHSEDHLADTTISSIEQQGASCFWLGQLVSYRKLQQQKSEQDIYNIYEKGCALGSSSACLEAAELVPHETNMESDETALKKLQFLRRACALNPYDCFFLGKYLEESGLHRKAASAYQRACRDGGHKPSCVLMYKLFKEPEKNRF